ncbi:unnamed protein product [Polarella glacialis]|uniref:Delta(14)-sterol reductase n=1 Tax=Polarella glacialis TaxID=89957 RepID=A0A813DJL0_POLGL|nr:unnamed protein product [Polarella glacialis]
MGLEVAPVMAVALFYGVAGLLHAILPAYSVDGYACDWSGNSLRYRLNGPLVLVVTWLAWLALPLSGRSFAARHFWSCSLASSGLGLVASAWLLATGKRAPAVRCLTVDQTELRRKAATGEDVQHLITHSPPRTALQHFFFGVEFNPRVLGERVDLKMLLYVLGAVGLQWNVLSAAALQQETYGAVSSAMVLYAAMLSFFIGEYMLGEVVHLYTYDLFCEKLGFKLAWGCLAFYPFFYCIGIWPLVASSASPGQDLSPIACATIAMLFGSGWVLTRGANMQKFVFKRRALPQSQQQPADAKCAGPSAGLLEQQSRWMGLRMDVVPGTRLLCTGFWGAARHINYLGEIVQAVALALPGALMAPPFLYYMILPWLYPLYFVALFVPRQIDDDGQLLAKYGEAAFNDYVSRVPYRILPGVW